MRTKINIKSVTKDATIMGPLAIVNLYIVFFISLFVVGLGFESFGFWSLLLWVIWYIIFVNMIIPIIEKIKKPKLTYNHRTKKLKYYHHLLQFRTFTKKSRIDIYAPSSKKVIEISYSYTEDVNIHKTAIIEIDVSNYDIIKQIQKDWHSA